MLITQESACKEIVPDPSSTFDVRCIDAVARSNHPNIVQVQDRWLDQWPSPKVCVQTELCHGDLNQYIEFRRTSGSQIDFRDMWNIALNIVDGLTYAHELGWSHRNIKPRNSMFPVSPTRLISRSIGKTSWYRRIWSTSVDLENLRLGLGAGASPTANCR